MLIHLAAKRLQIKCPATSSAERVRERCGRAINQTSLSALSGHTPARQPFHANIKQIPHILAVYHTYFLFRLEPSLDENPFMSLS
jgi:hypothetical protein